MLHSQALIPLHGTITTCFVLHREVLCVFFIWSQRHLAKKHDHFKSNPQHLPMYADNIYEHVIIVLWIPIGHRTKDQSLQSWPLAFQYPPCLERDPKYPVSFLCLIIWYILFNTVILPLHVNISAGFRGQVTRKKKKVATVIQFCTCTNSFREQVKGVLKHNELRSLWVVGTHSVV